MRLSGALLFLFIPLVLFLFLQQPLGVLQSLVLGLVIMIGHRFVASPFSRRNRDRRCLWCGRGTDESNCESTWVRVSREDPARYSLCSSKLRDCQSRWSGLHGLALRAGPILKLGIGLPLVHYLLAEFVRGARGSTWVTHENNALWFQAGIAVTVVSISFLYGRFRVGEGEAQHSASGSAAPANSSDLVSGAFPFPIHNLTLLGAGWTLWIFRIVGIWWLLRVARTLISAAG